MRRGLASFLTGALVAGAAVVGVGAPAHAASETITGGTLTWGYAADYRADLPVSPGTRAASGGASFVDDLATFPASTSSTWDGTDGTLRFSGDVRIGYAAGPTGNFLSLADPVVRITGTHGTLSALSAGKSHGVQPDAPSAVRTLADLDLSSAQRSDTPTSVTWTGIRATVAADGQDALVSLSSGTAELRPVGAELDPLSITLTKVAPAVTTATTLAVAPAATSTEGGAVTLTATVAPAASGTVEFRDGDAVLGSAETSGGVARLETTGLAVGDHSLTAAYTPADPAAFVGSTSAAVTHVVTAATPEPEPEPVADPRVTVSPSTGVDPDVENTFTVSGSGFVGPGAASGAYVMLGDASIWSGEGPAVAEGWLAVAWVRADQIVDGAFSTTLTIPAGSFDAGTEWVVATSAAHRLSVTDRSLDTFTPITLQGAEPVADPRVTVSPSTGVDPDVENTFTVSGSGFVGAGAASGAYVMLGDASIWSGEGPAVAEGWLAVAWVRADQIVDGAFSTTLTIPAGAFDAGTEWVVATSAAHRLSVTDRSLDTFTPIELAAQEPEWEPAIEVFAGDGTTPLGDTRVEVGDTLVVRGTGFDPAGNVGGRGVPVPADLPQGTYVVFGSFAEQWRPSAGAPSAARAVGSQSWALARDVLDQVPAQFQGVIRAAWTEIRADGTFEAELVVKNPAAVEGGRYGVYTYPASGVVNAAQELAVPVAYDAPAPLTVTPTGATVEAGESATLTVSGLPTGDAIKGVTLDGDKGTYSSDGSTVVLSVPADTPAGEVQVVVTSELGVTGSATLTVTRPTVVEPPVDPSVPTTVGSLSWGVRTSFVDYITGPIAKGGATTADGASVSGNVFTFRQSTPWSAPATGSSTGYAGTVRFTGHEGLLNLTVSNPRVRIDGPRAGTLVLDVTSSNLDGTSFAEKGVAFASLALPSPTTGGDGAVTYAGAPATLTAAGSAAFSGFYDAGAELAPVTFTVGAPAGTSGGGGGGTIGTPIGTPGGSPDLATARLSVTQVAPGDEVTISGAGFGAGEAGIRAEIRSTPRTLAQGITANAGGAASATVTIPADTAPGEHTLALVGADHEARAAITVVASGTTGSGAGSATTEEKCFAQGVNGATLTWGVSDRFRAYVTGPIAKGSVSTSGVRDNGTTFTWSGGKGSFNTDLGKGRASYGGTVSFSGHGGILDLRIANPRVVVNGSTGTLVVDVRSSDMEGTTSSTNGVAFASLDLSGKRSTSGSTITWSGAPATLTAAGAAAFAGFYDAGTALSPVTFSFPIGGDVECDVYSGLAATGSDGADLALLALTLLLTGGVLVGATRRRARARATA